MRIIFLKSYLHSCKCWEAFYGTFFPEEELEWLQVPSPKESLAGEKQEELWQSQDYSTGGEHERDSLITFCHRFQQRLELLSLHHIQVLSSHD